MVEKKQKEDFGLHAGQWVAAGLFGFASAYAAAVAKIRSEFFEDIANTPEVKSTRIEVANKIKKLWVDAPGMDRAEYFRKLIDYKKEMFDRFNDVAEAHHFRSGGWRGITLGIFDRARSMSNNSRRDVTISAGVTAVVAFGGALMFFKNREMSQDTKHMRQTLESMEARLQERDANKDSSPQR